MCRTWVEVLAAVVVVVSVAVTVSGVAERDSDFYLNRWNDKNSGKSKAIAQENPTAQIPSPLLSPWSRLPPGATGKLILTAAGTSNTTTQIPDDAQLLPPSLVDPPSTSPTFRNSSERDPKRERHSRPACHLESLRGQQSPSAAVHEGGREVEDQNG
ncbi:hypothetical protein E2C01_053706 [Portunus trituberculatus]|uniref:Uncharacterized protein n=1 Tax=Portunus trituberculatus TaxID=210409 RepID=A0A5B7GHH3_PORTR|nr:hypothetical protein [Portunus trituberculatus]